MHSLQHKVLFDARDFRVRSVVTGVARQCIVTFSPVQISRDLDRPGFLEGFFRRHGIDAIHVIARSNALFSYPEFPDALRCIAAAVRSYSWVGTCGSSMGGYAAIRFAEEIGAQQAIAFSPVYSLACKLVPFERRWRPIKWAFPSLQCERPHGSARVRPVVFYDPRSPDSLHFDLIRRHYPDTQGVPIPYGGHPCGVVLQELRLLDKVLVEFVNDQFDAVATARVIRSRRRLSGQYWSTLARCLAPGHFSLKRRLAEGAINTGREAGYLIYVAVLAEIQGDHAHAERCLVDALGLAPEGLEPVRAMAGFRLRHGEPQGALPFALKLCDLDAQPIHRRLLALTWVRNGNAHQASASLRGVPGAALLRIALLLADMGLISLAGVDRWMSSFRSFQYATGLMGEFERTDLYQWAKTRKAHLTAQGTFFGAVGAWWAHVISHAACLYALVKGGR